MTQVANRPMPTTVKALCDSPRSDETRKMRNSITCTEGLGHGEEPVVPATVDLGYDEEVQTDIPVDAAPIKAVKRKSQRNNFSIYGNIDLSPEIEAQAAAWTDSDDSDYSESSELSEDMEDDDDDDSYLSGEDPADFVHASLNHQGSFYSKNAAARTPSFSSILSVDTNDGSNPNIPARVELQFGEDDPDTPRRISLQFNQTMSGSGRSLGGSGRSLGGSGRSLGGSGRSLGGSGRSLSSSSSRRGRLDVSLGTSSLPRRCVSASSTRVTLSRGPSYTAERRSCSDMVNLPKQQQSIRRTTMDVAGSRPPVLVRGISHDTAIRRPTLDHTRNSLGHRCNSLGRRTTLDHTRNSLGHRSNSLGRNSLGRRTTLDHNAPCPPPRRVSRNPSMSQVRRMTMEHCTDNSDDAPPRTRPSLNRSSRIIAGAPDSQAGRRLTMDLKSSVPMAGAAAMMPPKRSTWAAKRRSTLDHHVAPPSRRSTSAARPSTLSAARRITLDHSRPCPPARRVSRNPSARPVRRTTLDHCADQSPEEEAPTARRSLGRSTMVMAGAPESKTGRRLTMDLKSDNPAAMSSAVRRVTMSTATAATAARHERNCSSHSPVGRGLPRSTFSGMAA